jgi:hypothetical protein
MPEHQPHISTPEQSSDTHQTPFYVLPTLEGDKLLTLPGGQLIRGTRNAVTSSERNAIAIAGRYGLTAKARGGLVATEPMNAYGYVVEPAWRTPVPEYADLIQTDELAEHSHSLELHDRELLLARIEVEVADIIEARLHQPNDHDSLEHRYRTRRTDGIFVRALGNFLLRHH